MRTPPLVAALGLLLALAFVRPSTMHARQLDIAEKIGFGDFLTKTADLSTRIAAVDAAHARDLAASLPAKWDVQHGNEIYRIDTDWITGPLRQAAARPAEWTRTRSALLARLDAVHALAMDLDKWERQINSSTLSPAAARATLREVLARREFEGRDEARWSESIRRWFQRTIDALLDRFGLNRSATAAVSRAFAWVVALGAVLALGTYLYRARLPRRELTPLAIETPHASSGEWVARAYAALRAGDAREAMHCGYHAVLFRLEEQGVWRVDDSRTPREYVSLLPTTDARRSAFVDLARQFERAWYGSRAVDEQGLLHQLEAFGCVAPSKPAI